MKCARCGQDFKYPGFKTNICGNCADDLRQEQLAYDLAEESAYSTQEQSEVSGETRGVQTFLFV